ncbi:MAG: ATP-binding protein [Ramlibacter sp.]|nr:ATP-binding protein [Ramlibacter sp.]
MKQGFVQTDNFRRLRDAEKLVARRGAREAGLVIIKGVFGVGKSKLTERWAADSGYVFVRAKETWTKRALLDELADAMGLAKGGRNQEVQARIITKIGIDMVPIIVDEADHLVRSTASLLEVLRDITDVTGTMCFLVGMEHFPMKVARYGHIASRVAKVVEFEPLSLGDVKATVTAKATQGTAQNAPALPMDDALIEEIHRQASGRMRLVLNAIANIEQWAEANGWKKVTLGDVKGKALCTEFSGVALGKRRGD